MGQGLSTPHPAVAAGVCASLALGVWGGTGVTLEGREDWPRTLQCRHWRRLACRWALGWAERVGNLAA